jgi:hypothetical protein
MLLLGGCEGVQSVLHPHGPAAERLAMISWVLSGGATAIFVAVMALDLRPDPPAAPGLFSAAAD